MDEIVSKIAALGVPGLILIMAINATGLFGGAAITTALAALGSFGNRRGKKSWKLRLINWKQM